jgi:aryl-alcohol dehydrogenase-like predicted oxidoreductase
VRHSGANAFLFLKLHFLCLTNHHLSNFNASIVIPYIMHYQQLGPSDLHISKISFGCMSLKPDTPQKEELLREAFQAGINYFDTADLYDKGLNEELVGKVFKDNRKEVILASKVGNQWRSDGSGWDWNPRKDYILASVEQSLKRLQTDYIDLYQLHGGTIQDPIDETIEAFEILVQQGKIRYYGISSIRPNVIREWVNRSGIVSVMTQYSLLDRRPEETTLPLLQQKGIGVLARGSLAQGLLVDKPAKEYLSYTAEEVQRAALAIQSLSSKERSPAAAALRFVVQNPAVTSAVAGIRTKEQLKEALDALQAPPLRESERQILQNSLPPNLYTDHR